MMDVFQLLQRLGFGEYEAKAYVALLKQSPLTGYELARASGIPRANVYAVLPRLEERGAVLRIDSQAGTRYVAVPPEQLTARLADRFHHDLSAARGALAEMDNPAARDYVWNAQGYPALLDHARTLVDGAQKELLVALWPQESEALAESLTAAEERGVAITTLCLAACAHECDGCQGDIFRYRLAPEQAARWLVIVADGEEMLAGEARPGDEAITVRTRQRLLIELAAWYVRNSIVLATLLSDAGERIAPLLSPGTASALASVVPGGASGSLHDLVRQMLVGGAVSNE